MATFRTTKTDLFWADDISILFNLRRIIEFFPTPDMSSEEKLNAISRLFIYSSAILLLYKSAIWPLYIMIFGLLLTLFLHKTSKYQKHLNGFGADGSIGKEYDDIGTLKSCTAPTKNNPFMNVSLNEIHDNPTRPQACGHTDDIKDSMETNFNHNLYKDIDDLFGKNNSQRQFYTNPITTVPNDQDSFAKWLYSVPATCKEDQENCLRYEDLRNNRPTFVDYDDNLNHFLQI